MRALNVEQMEQLEGGGCNEIVSGSAAGVGGAAAIAAAAKKGATWGSILGPKGAIGGALLGGLIASSCYLLPE